ncbi:MAG: esterase family protein [Fimbriimonadales bacterium]|nr:esterase family protein [Fimbriimonadales bacterium]
MPFAELRYFSEALQKHTAVNLLLPDPKLPGPYPVMFLLHGLSDDHTIWMRRTSIERYCDGLPLLVAMPDGGRGFYVDALDGFAYETALAVELPSLLQAYFPTTDRWCATGLSMGGYGAVRFALRYPERFVSAHSLSGALAFGHSTELPKRPDAREFERLVGSSPKGSDFDLLALAERLEPARRPALRFDCGTEDFLLESNRCFHEHLAKLGFPHEYEEFPGDHEWGYWDLHVREAIEFHRRQLGF